MRPARCAAAAIPPEKQTARGWRTILRAAVGGVRPRRRGLAYLAPDTQRKAVLETNTEFVIR